MVHISMKSVQWYTLFCECLQYYTHFLINICIQEMNTNESAEFRIVCIWEMFNVPLHRPITKDPSPSQPQDHNLTSCCILLHSHYHQPTTKTWTRTQHQHHQQHLILDQKDSQTLRQRPQCRRGASPSRPPQPPWIPTRGGARGGREGAVTPPGSAKKIVGWLLNFSKKKVCIWFDNISISKLHFFL